MTEYADCSFCGGRVLERQVQKACWWGDKLLAIVECVPTGVCGQCGEKYYKAKVLKAIETLLEEKKAFNHKISIPVADYRQACGV